MPSHLATPRILFHDRRAPARSRLGRATAAILAVALFLAAPVAAVLLRDRIAAAIPQAAQLYDALGLTIGPALRIVDVSPVLRDEGRSTVLEIEGEIDNPGAQAERAGSLRIAILGADGGELYHWMAAPPKDRLRGGESISFRTRLEDPPAAAASVKVRFARPGDELWLPPS